MRVSRRRRRDHCLVPESSFRCGLQEQTRTQHIRGCIRELRDRARGQKGIGSYRRIKRVLDVAYDRKREV